MKKVYVDTNILIDYCWWKYFSESETKKSNSVIAIQKGFDNNSNYEIYISNYTLIEIANHFRDWFLLKKVTSSGFSYKDFSKEKHKFSLSEEELSLIDKITTDLEEHPNINFIKVDNMGKEFLDKVMVYIKNYVDFFDAIHLRIALDTKCTYLLTKDSPFRKRIQELINNKLIENQLQPITLSGLLQL